MGGHAALSPPALRPAAWMSPGVSTGIEKAPGLTGTELTGTTARVYAEKGPTTGPLPATVVRRRTRRYRV